jgi:hypothetical protein
MRQGSCVNMHSCTPRHEVIGHIRLHYAAFYINPRVHLFLSLLLLVFHSPWTLKLVILRQSSGSKIVHLDRRLNSVSAPATERRSPSVCMSLIIFRTFAAFVAILQGVSCVQPEAPAPIEAPLRDLPWAQLNFLHTTDIHGWWGGHLQE